MITLINNFHNTEVRVNPKIINSNLFELNKRQVLRANKKLCPSKECTCSGALKVRGSGIVDIVDFNDGSIRILF